MLDWQKHDNCASLVCNAEVSKNGDPFVCSFSSGRNGLTKNVPAKKPTPTRECRAKVKGLDFMGPIV